MRHPVRKKPKPAVRRPVVRAENLSWRPFVRPLVAQHRAALDRLVQVWLAYDPNPPRALLSKALSLHGEDGARALIRTVGRATR